MALVGWPYSNPTSQAQLDLKVDLNDGVAKECRFLAYNRNLVVFLKKKKSRMFLLHIYIYTVNFLDLFLDMMEFKFSSVSFLFKLPHVF